MEPGPYATDWLARGSRHSTPLPVYDGVRAAQSPDFVAGDPVATADAVMELVQAQDPPARLVLGRVLPEIEAVYAARLATWDAWRTVSERAFGR